MQIYSYSSYFLYITRNILFVIAIFFAGCDKPDMQIDSKTRGEIAPDSEVFVQFKQNIVPSSSLKAVLPISATINGESKDIGVSFTQENKLVILFQSPLSPNTSYTIYIPTKMINTKFDAHIINENLNLKFITKPNYINVSNLNFRSIGNNSYNIEANIAPLYPIDSKLLFNAISIKDSNGMDVSFRLKDMRDNSFVLKSEKLSALNDEDREFNLFFDSSLLGLKEAMVVPITLYKDSQISVVDIKPKIGKESSIMIRFSSDIAKNVNLKDFIQISPKVDFNVSQANNIIYLNGSFVTNTKYSISVLKGLKASNNAILKDTVIKDIAIRDMMPSIVFSSSGIFLPQSANKKIAFKSMNVKKVKLIIHRIYPNNITQFFQSTGNFVYGNNNSPNSTYIYENIYRLGDEVLKQEFNIDSKKNDWVQNEIDLSSIKDTSGIFIVELSLDKDGIDYVFDKKEYDSYDIDRFFRHQGRVAKHLIFSKIALIAQRGISNNSDNILVSALSIDDNKPLANVSIEAISRNNQSLAKATTDKDGNALLNIKDKKSDVLYLLAQLGNNVSLLNLNYQRLSNDEFDVGERVLKDGIQAFIYTDRGVYRPGDSLHLSAIVRSNNIPINHPIKLSITDSRSKAILKDYLLYPSNINQAQPKLVILNNVSNVLDSKAGKPNTDGIYYYEFKIPKNAPTGVWEAKLQVGDSTFFKQLSVKTIVQDRIKVKIKSKDSIDFNSSKSLDFSLQGDYLFGAPAKDLQYEASLSIKPKDFSSKKYKNYAFSSYSNLDYSANDNKKGKLDSKGFAQVKFDLTKLLAVANKNMQAVVVAKIFENGGRYSTSSSVISLNKYDSFVGIGDLGGKNVIEPNKEINIPVIAIASDDSRLLSGRKLRYKIYQNNNSWWFDYDNDRYLSYNIKTDANTQIISEGELISQDKPVILKHTFKNSGEILIEITDVVNGATSQSKLYVDDWGSPFQNKNITSLKIQSDKSEYKVGDVAKVSFESVEGAKALVTLSKSGNILKRFWVDTKSSQTSIDIPLDKNLAPNAYVTVSLLQDYRTNNDRPLRLYGIVSLNVKDDGNVLKLSIDAPKEVKPNSKVVINLSNDKKKRVTYTLAVVDEGLLSLNDFKTPNPYKYFFAKLPLALRVFDTYDLIIAKTFGKVNKILRAGGDYATKSMSMSDIRMSKARKGGLGDDYANRFKPVVFFLPPTSTDSNGNAQIELTMPSYMGQVRVMAVAVNEDTVSSAERDIEVKAPLVMIPTMPRSLKVGDKFSLPIEVFRLNPKIKNATLSLKTKNQFISFDKSELSVDFNGINSKTIVFEGVVGDTIGIENIEIALSNKDFKFIDSTEIDIKPINPYITLTKKYVLKPGSSLSLSTYLNFVQGSNTGFVTISNTPLFNIDHRLRWLIRYPYGCIEQTTSSVLPQLFIDKISTSKFIDKKELIKNINIAIERIQNFQVANGGFSYWQQEGEADRYGSNYAGHFLLLAKQQGYYVPESMLKKWIEYQVEQVKSNSKYDLNMIYSLYLLALANNPQIGIMNTIYENNLSKLSITEKWLLAASYQMSSMPEIAKKITQNLPIIDDDSENYIYSYGSSFRNEAIIANAYYQIYQTAPKSLDLALTKLESDTRFSTQELGYWLMTFGQMKEDTKDSLISGTISINKSKSVFNENTPYVVFDFSNGKADITSNSNQDLYINYVWDGIPTDIVPTKISNNIILKQEFLNESGTIIDPTDLQSGSSFYIKLSLLPMDNTNIDVKNMALTQMLPSGWEIENMQLNNQDMPAFISKATTFNIAYTDIRDDRIMWFFDYDSGYRKSREFFVKIIAVTPGEYILPPATAEAMYSNMYQATTTGMKVKVHAK